MQLVLSLSPIDEPQVEGVAAEWLFHKVGGVPLLVRVIATAWKSGCTSALVLHPKSHSGENLKRRLSSGLLASFRIETITLTRIVPLTGSPLKAAWSRGSSGFPGTL